MAFIAIDAKADVEGSKKGRVTPAQHAILNAWSLGNETGILKFGGNCRATASSYTGAGNKATIEFKNGFLVIYGRLVEFENGTTLDVSLPASGSRTGIIVARFTLSSSGDKEFEVTDKIGNVVTQQNLHSYQTGTYEFVLYKYTATASSITLEEPENLVYINTNKDIYQQNNNRLNGIETNITSIETDINNIETNIESIEGKLKLLGFREGSIGTNADAALTNEIKRQGNYVFGNLNVSASDGSGYEYGKNLTVSIPENFRPKSDVSFSSYIAVKFIRDTSYVVDKLGGTITIKTNGEVSIVPLGVNYYAIKGININFGYEAPPIK